MGIRKGLQAQGAVVEVLRVGLFVVQERSGVAIGASAQVTPAWIRYEHEKILSYDLHQLSTSTETCSSSGGTFPFGSLG